MDDGWHFERQGRAFGLGAYFGWVAASAAGAVLGMAFMYLLIFVARAIVPGLNEDRFSGQILLPLLGAFIGAGQWLLLRERVPHAGWWIVATAVGLWAGALIIPRALGLQLPPVYSRALLLAGPGVGLCIGLAQLLVLRPGLRRSLLWLAASVLGWLCLVLIVGESLDHISDLVALGAAPAAFTGAALAWGGVASHSGAP